MKQENAEIPPDKIWVIVRDHNSAMAAWLELRDRASTNTTKIVEPDSDLI